MIQSSAPAKVILFGEHAVVYGQPAIAAPVTSLRARVTAEKAPSKAGLSILISATSQKLAVLPGGQEDESSLALAAKLALAEWRITKTPDLTLVLNSDIALGRGLGSGAAVSAALIRALAMVLEVPLTDEALNTLVYEIEKKHHGTPSGIDNTVIVYEKPIYFVRGRPLEPIQIGEAFTLLIADSGYGTPTHVPVGDVRRLLERRPEYTQPLLDRIGEVTHSAREAIETGRIAELGVLMNENHDLLQRLTVSSVELDVLCEVALAAGALGAKMSGGGRGGNMLALVTDAETEAVTRALYSAGAVRVVKTRVRPPEN